MDEKMDINLHDLIAKISEKSHETITYRKLVQILLSVAVVTKE